MHSLYEKDAYWLYYWADQWLLDGGRVAVYGTLVIIFGEYPFGQQKQWLLLESNNKVLEILPSKLKELTNDFLPIIMERQMKRDTLVIN